MKFNLNIKSRSEAWAYLLQELENYYGETGSLPVSPQLNKEMINEYVHQHTFQTPLDYDEAIEHVVNGLTQFTVHTSHPKYFGLFNPRSNVAGILADTITATFNPQLAAWSHAPFAVEVENRLIREIGIKFGYEDTSIDGTFTSGGAEANLTAVLCALNKAFPEYANKGLRAVDKDPVIYVSAESHHSLIKAARVAGLGMNAVRSIAVDHSLQMQPEALRKQIDADIKENRFPLMVVATMGTTGTGAIDDIGAIYEIISKYNLWLHADAAYGAAVALTQRYKKLVQNIHFADSITFDAHKWMSVPMGAGMFITKYPSILDETFRITAGYMPREADELKITDPFTHSIQWSRRFTGLKMYLSLLMFGWEGYEQVIGRQIELGNLLKTELRQAGWKILNQTDLPIVCFEMEYFEEDPDAAMQFSKKIIDSGNAWVSVYSINGINALRACITNYATDENSIRQLLETLNDS